MNWTLAVNVANVAITAACLATTIAIKTQSRQQIADHARKADDEVNAVKRDMVGSIDMAHKRGIEDGKVMGANTALYAIKSSIDSGCDVDDIRYGLDNGFIPMGHKNRRVDG